MTDDIDNPITKFRPWLRSSAKGINYEEFKQKCEEIEMSEDWSEDSEEKIKK